MQRRNHEPRLTESFKIKLQAFASPKSETLQSQTPARPQNQLPLNGLKGSSVGGSYACPGFYPLTARDLTHAASLFATWRARRIFGPRATCAEVMLQEEIAGGGRFEVRLFEQYGCLRGNLPVHGDWRRSLIGRPAGGADRNKPGRPVSDSNSSRARTKLGGMGARHSRNCHRNCHRTAEYKLLQRSTTPKPDPRKVQ